MKGLNGVEWLLPIEVAFDPRASGRPGKLPRLGNRKGKEWEGWKVTPAFELKYQQ